MYFDYWRLQTAPFDNVADPRMYWEQGFPLGKAAAEVVFALREGNDVLAVITGESGTGKTLALRLIMERMAPERFDRVLIANPSLTFVQLLREILGQLEETGSASRFKDELLETLKRRLLAAAAQGRRLLLLVDEADTIKPSVLQELRVLTNFQQGARNLVAIVLAGRPELAARLGSPALAALSERIGVSCRLTGLSGATQVAEYLRGRLFRAGGGSEIFSKDAAAAIWRHSRGIPRTINTLAKWALKEGETQGIITIEAGLIERLARKLFRHPEAAPAAPGGKTASPVQPAAGAESREAVPANPAVSGKGERGSGPAARAGKGRAVPAKAMPSVSEAKDLTRKLFTERKEVSQTSVDTVRGLPPDVLGRLSGMHDEEILRLASALAAKTTEAREKEILKAAGDPMDFWETTRDEIASILMLIRHRSMPVKDLQ